MQKPRIALPFVVLALTACVSRNEAEPARIQVQHKSPVLSIAWSPDGKWLATGTADGTVRIIEPDSGKEIRRFATDEAVPVLIVASDSRTLGIVSANQRVIRFWDSGSDENQKKLNGLSGSDFRFQHGRFALSKIADGGAFISGLHEGKYYFFYQHLGERGEGKAFQQIGGDVSAFACDASAGGSCDSNGDLFIQHDPKSHLIGKGKSFHVGKAHNMAFIPKRSHVAVATENNCLQVWDWAQQLKIASLTGLTQPVQSLVPSYDGNTLIALTADRRRIVSWDLISMTKRSHLNHYTGKVHALAVSSDGKKIATSTEKGKTLYLWDATTSRALVPRDKPLNLSNEQFETLWDELADQKNTRKANDAWHQLGAVGDAVIPLLRQKVFPFAAPLTGENIAQLVTNLGADKFVTREKATQELIDLGEVAVLAIQRLLDNPPSLEAARRAREVLKKIDEPELTLDRIRVLEAIDLLEQMGTAKAVELLQEIEFDALIAQIHREASEALKRLNSIKKAK